MKVESEREREGHVPNGLNDFVSSIVMFILKTKRGGKILNTSQCDPLKSTATQSSASKTTIKFNHRRLS